LPSPPPWPETACRGWRESGSGSCYPSLSFCLLEATDLRGADHVLQHHAVTKDEVPDLAVRDRVDEARELTGLLAVSQPRRAHDALGVEPETVGAAEQLGQDVHRGLVLGLRRFRHAGLGLVVDDALRLRGL